MRAREKEIVKRRLAALADAQRRRSRRCIDDSVAPLQRRRRPAAQLRSRSIALLNAQSYRLAHWRVASEEINYRRFFDVNQLAALRMEDPAVFDEVHRFVFELVRRGAATGLRIDHVDGLFAPGDYLRRLQERCGGDADAGRRRFYIVVEKILGAGEQLPADWPVHGTTGYEFAAVGQQPVRRPAQRARARRHLPRGSSASGASGCRSPISPIAARSRCCTRRCRATSTRSATS